MLFRSKVVSYCQEPSQIINYSLFDENDRAISLKIDSIKRKSGNKNETLIAKINDIKDRNKAEEFIGLEIFTNRQDFEKLPEDEFYFVDLINLNVVDNNYKKLGIVKNVFDYGAGGVIEIEFNKETQKHNKINQLENFPFKNEFFPQIDIDKGYIILSSEYINNS